MTRRGLVISLSPGRILAMLFCCWLAGPALAPAQLSPRVTPLPLNLSQPPATEEIMAAGHLSGPLYRTHEIPEPRRRAQVNLSFGAALQAWNNRDYDTARTRFGEHLAKFPESPWAAEGLLFIGWEALAQGRFAEAGRFFQEGLNTAKAGNHPEARMMRDKARICLSDLMARQGNLDQAMANLRLVLQDSPDWRFRTYAIHWLQTYSRQRQTAPPTGLKPTENFGSVGSPRAEGHLGEPDRDGEGQDQCSIGAPKWRVNLVNLNFYASDTPLWYQSPIGPPVAIKVSFNSLSALARYEPFGNKWQFSYFSYLMEDRGGVVTIYMPDGRRDIYTPDGTGGYLPPFQVFNRLIKIAPSQFELRFRDDTSYVYSIPTGTAAVHPFLTIIRDAHGLNLTLGYNAAVQLNTVTDAMGRVTTLTYNSAGLVTQVTDPFGRDALFEYDANRNLTKLTDMGGYWSSLSYDDNIFIKSITNARGSWQIFTEAVDGRISSGLYPAPGQPMGENFRITITNPVGNQEEFYYCGVDTTTYTWHVRPSNYIPYVSSTQNNYASAAKTMYHFTTNTSGLIGRIDFPAGGSVTYNYDAAGNRTNVSDYWGSWSYTYNTLGLVTSVTNPRGAVTTLTYAANNVDLISATNGLGTETLAYNGTHDITSVTDRLGNNTSFAYNGYGQIASAQDALGIVTAFGYDSAHRLVAVTRASQTLQQYTYDALDRVRTRTDATGLTLTYDYNDLDQVTKITYPDNKFRSFQYSTCCPFMLDSITERSGLITFFSYNKYSQLTTVTDPAGGVIRLGYDPNGNRSEIIDPKGNITRFNYDFNNRLAKKTYADGNYELFTYNKSDSSDLVAVRRNARGITTNYNYDSDHQIASFYDNNKASTNYSYDVYGRLTTAETPAGTYNYSYDANSRLVSVDGPWANDLLTYQYDALGRRIGMAREKGQPVSYAYDSLHRLTSVNTGGQVYSYVYAGSSPLVQSLSRPNTSVTAYQYDALRRLAQMTTQVSGVTINQYTYTYNQQDLRGSEAAIEPGSMAGYTNRLANFAYNNVNQLVKVSDPADKPLYYDESGNLIRGYTPDGYAFTATYDADNHLLSLSYHDDTGAVNRTDYTYAGNLLLAVKNYLNGTLTKETQYVYDGPLLVQERDGANNVLNEYTYGLNLGGGIGGLLHLNQSGAPYSYLYDGKGNVTALLDGTAGVAAAYQYDPFGRRRAQSGSLTQPMQFSTKPYDEKTGLSYYLFRFYNPALGRWMTRDPLEEQGGINMYMFVKNNPTNIIDQFGLQDDSITRPIFDILVNLSEVTFSVIEILEDKGLQPSSWLKLMQASTELGADLFNLMDILIWNYYHKKVHNEPLISAFSPSICQLTKFPSPPAPNPRIIVDNTNIINKHYYIYPPFFH